ncbi:MAG: alpha-L-fucosidase [Saprospiraceae bacterium]|nr:alpha-L-fucosidase [Saprospiraceae bacterium]
MKRSYLWLLLMLSLPWMAFSQMQESKAERDRRMEWWRDAGFGMFIHWGVYSVPAGIYKGEETKGIGEWIMHSANIPTAEYEEFVHQFNPTKFDAKKWVDIAKSAGVKYIVITSKHHDGFCLWDSKVTQYDIMDASPFKRDILRELTDACKAAGIKMCFYHSIMDWHQPDAESKKNYTHQNTENPDWANYRENYLKPQIKELIENYDPAVLWFDGEWIPEWTEDQGKDLYHFIKQLSPNIIINNRIGKGRKGMNGMNEYADAAGDFGTPEQEILEGTSNYDWESCMTMNDTWGFKKNDHNWKAPEKLISNLIDVAAKGGNYLLNVGPTAEGLIPAESVDRLEEMGKWLKTNGESIYNTRSRKNYKEGEHLKFTESKDGKYTYVIADQLNGPTATIHDIHPKAGSKIYLLGSKKSLAWTQLSNGDYLITLPKKVKGKYAWVFKVVND